MRDPSEVRGLEMSPEEMRRLGYRVVDQVVARWVGLGEGAAWEGGARRELEPLLGGDPPELGLDPDAVMDRALQDILPRAGRIDHPRFFAFIPSSPTWPSILGEYLATGYNIFQGTWLESAGPSQLELVVMDWFRSWLDLPESGGGLLDLRRVGGEPGGTGDRSGGCREPPPGDHLSQRSGAQLSGASCPNHGHSRGEGPEGPYR